MIRPLAIYNRLYRFKMRRVYAVAMSTKVIHLMAICNRPHEYRVKRTMSQRLTGATIALPITIFAEMALPNPAA